MQALVVYQLKCTCGKTYVGKTERNIFVRMEEHKTGVGTAEYKSSCFTHTQQFNHSIDYDKVKIIDKASNNHQLLLKEMLHIDKLKPELNKQKHSYTNSLIIG